MRRGSCRPPLRWLALAGLGAPLLVLAFVGVFSRYAADDYCTAAQVQVAGFFEAQSRLYVGWSGRFAATLLITLLEAIGPWAVRLLPAMALVAWVSAATWAAYHVSAALGRQLTFVSSAVLGALIVFATLQTTADLPQILFWQTGVLTYLAPLVLATLYAGWVARASRATAVRWPIAAGVSFALALLAGGTSETFAAAQVTALALALMITLIAGAGRNLRAMLLVGLLGAVLALGVLAIAPGNSVRQETAAPSPLSIAIPQALEFTQGWLRLTFARPHAAVLLLLLGVPAAIGATSPRVAWRWPIVGASVVGVALVVVAGMLPAYYALSSNPPGRAQVIPQYVLVCAVAMLGWFLGATLRRPMPNWVAAPALIALLAFGPAAMALDTVKAIEPASAYAAAWDQLDRQVRAERTQGVLDVTVRPLPSTGLVQNLDFVGPDRHDWFNGCVARYYDVNTIASTLSVP
jgi:hypothetical protein